MALRISDQALVNMALSFPDENAERAVRLYLEERGIHYYKEVLHVIVNLVRQAALLAKEEAQDGE